MILAGKRVAFTGQLASMTRTEAADLVRAHGGMFSSVVSERTSILVVGQEGWPLDKDGTISKKLATANRLCTEGRAVAVLTEEQFFTELGLEGVNDGIHKRFSLAQLARLVKVTRDRLRAWMRAGLLTPLETVQGVAYFDFHQVTRVKALWELTQSGVKTETIRRSLQQLARWVPGIENARLLEPDGRLLVRLDDGHLAEPSGQLRFDFDADEEATAEEEPVASEAPAACSAEELWEKGYALEESGQLDEAVTAYREAIYLGGPTAYTCYNLANVLLKLGQLGQAAERYRQAIELDHECAEAWNNLGSVLGQLGEAEEALGAYYRALDLNPAFADAHYNLADALEQAGRFSEARRHWKEYLRHEQIGEWADYARRRLAN